MDLLRFLMDLQWMRDGFAMDLRWIRYGFALDLLWVAYGFAMDSLTVGPRAKPSTSTFSFPC